MHEKFDSLCRLIHTAIHAWTLVVLSYGSLKVAAYSLGTPVMRDGPGDTFFRASEYLR